MNRDERLLDVQRWLRYAEEDLTAAVAMSKKEESGGQKAGD